jgi:ABC-2 type transport system permease protein
MVAALMLGLGAAIVTVTIAAEVTAIGGNDVAWEGVGAVEIAKSGLLQEAMLLQGLAFGLVILNSAGAIATFFVLPTAFGLVVSMWKALSDIGPWVNFNGALGVLLEPRSMSGEEWAHFGVASLIWIVLPLIAGLFRVLRRDVLVEEEEFLDVVRVELEVQD